MNIVKVWFFAPRVLSQLEGVSKGFRKQDKSQKYNCTWKRPGGGKELYSANIIDILTETNHILFKWSWKLEGLIAPFMGKIIVTVKLEFLLGGWWLNYTPKSSQSSLNNSLIVSVIRPSVIRYLEESPSINFIHCLQLCLRYLRQIDIRYLFWGTHSFYFFFLTALVKYKKLPLLGILEIENTIN